jgi:protein phosphatase
MVDPAPDEPHTADDIVHGVFQSYESMFCLLQEEVATLGDLIPLPKFPIGTLMLLFDETQRRMSASTALVNVPAPCIIVGDLHGNFHDMMRVFTTVKEPFAQRYLFLGDYVDRGDYSLDILVLLFCLYCLYPGQFTLLRGNHEFPVVNEWHGFRAEVMERYGDDALWRMANAIFQYMPLAALVSGRCLCVHGGIGPGVQLLEDIAAIPLPLASYDDFKTASILWSDPGETIVAHFEPSQRGTGCLFSAGAVTHFLTVNKLEYLIRAHQCVKHGISLFANKKCVTVFSSSNYSGENAAAFLQMHPTQGPTYFTLLPETFIRRPLALFAEAEERKKRLGGHAGRGAQFTRMDSKGPSRRSSRALLGMGRGLVEAIGAAVLRPGGLRASASQMLPNLDMSLSSILAPLRAVEKGGGEISECGEDCH